MAIKRFSWRAWLQLLRAPNLLTVPGDPLAGFSLALGTAAVPSGACGLACLAAVLFYMSGLLLNDYADYEVDLRERPARPLPSGQVHPGQVLGAAILCIAAGLVVCWFISIRSILTAGILIGCIAAYNFRLKHSTCAGPLTMGLCRGLSLLLGASAARPVLWPDQVAWGALMNLAYIAMVTQVARHEMSSRQIGLWGWGPAAIVILGILASPAGLGSSWIGLLALAPVLSLAGWGGWRIFHESKPAVTQADPGQTPPGRIIPAIIGQWIGALILLQSAMIFLAASGRFWGGFSAGIGLLLWGLNRLMARWFYAS